MANLPALSLIPPPDGGEPVTGSTLFQFKVRRTSNVSPTCSVDWQVKGNVDTADFVTGQPLSGRVNFAANQATDGTIDLYIRQDNLVEVNETLTVELVNPIGAVLLTLPPHAEALTVADDYKVTYKPLSGFTGTETFPYSAKNSDGQVGNANIPVEVKPTTPTDPTFSNSYKQKIEGFVAPDSEAMTGFELLFDITDPRLKLDTNPGGVVRSATGQDIRLEDGAGNVVPYARLRYNGTQGRIVGIAKRDRQTGSAATFANWNNLELYAGKVGMLVDEANPGTALNGLLACWRLDNGVDISNHGRNLTLSDATAIGTPATTVFEEPAGNFDRTKSHQASLTNPSSWLNGLSAFTLAMDLHLDQIALDSGVFRTDGIDIERDNLCTMAVRADSNSFSPAPAANNIWFAILKITATLCRIQTGADTAKVGVPTTFALTWQNGQSITALSDDALLTLAYNEVAAPNGTLSVPNGPLVIAGGPRGYFDGKIGLVRMAAARRTNAWLRAEQRNRLYPKALLAWGEAVGPNDTASCVAFPGTATATGSDLTIPMPALNTGTSIKFVLPVTSEKGAEVSLIGPANTSLLYKQKSVTGVDHVTYTIQDSLLRKSTSIITVTVSGTALVLGDEGPFEVTGTADLVIDVQANDTGVGRHITAVTVANPALSTAVEQGPDDNTATIKYNSIKPFYGTDSFTYTVTDGAGQVRTSNPISVTVRRPPIAAAAITAADITAGDSVGRLISPLADPNTIGVDLFLPSQTFVPVPGIGAAALSGTNQIKYTPPASVATATNVSFSYKIKDAYAQEATGTITVKVNPAPVDVTASPDTYPAVTAGTPNATLSPSPLANDTLNGTPNAAALTIQALPGGGAGSAGGTFALVSASKGVSYTPPASIAVAVNDTITYTITDSATPTAHTDSAVITVPVNPVSVPGRPKDPGTPIASKQLTVGWTGPGGTAKRYNTLALAYAAAVAGDHIYLEDSTTAYTADLPFNKSIAATNPIVIRGRPMAGGSATPRATVTGGWTVNGQGHWFHELTFRRPPGLGRLGINGTYVTITRCWFRDNGVTGVGSGIDVYINGQGSAHHVLIGWCRFTSRWGSNHIFLEHNGPQFGTVTAASHPHHSAIYRNYFWCNVNLAGVDDHIIYFGDSHITNRATDVGAMDIDIEENYFDNCLRERTLYLKRACRVTRNRSRASAGQWGFRHGANGRVWGNRVEGGTPGFGGWNHDFRKNIFTASVAMKCGATRLTNPAGFTQAVDGALLVANTGTFVFGHMDPSGQPYYLDPPADRSDQTDDQPDNVAGGKVDGVNVWEATNTVVDRTKFSQNIVAGNAGIFNHGATAYTVDNLTAGITIIPAGWDYDDTGFETGSNQASAT